MTTKTVATFANGSIEFQVDIDEANGYVTAIRCINGSDHAVTGSVTRVDNGRKASGTFDPGTTTINVPTGQQSRLATYIDARGHLSGLALAFEG